MSYDQIAGVKKHRTHHLVYLFAVVVVVLCAVGAFLRILRGHGSHQRAQKVERKGRAVSLEAEAGSMTRLNSEQFEYLGAFRLPYEFSWGARGLSFDPNGGNDGKGSLLVTGPELTVGDNFEPCSWDGVQNCKAFFGEVSIPDPVKGAFEELPTAESIRELTAFDDGLVRRFLHPDGLFTHFFVAGIELVSPQGSQTTPKLYGSLQEWYPEGDFGDNSFPTVWFSERNGAFARGPYHVGPPDNPLFHGRKMGDFIFHVPRWYADNYLGGRTLVTGGSRGTAIDLAPGLDAGGATYGGSQGPTLFAFSPFAEDSPPDGQHLDALAMLYYRVKYEQCAAPDVGVAGEELTCDFPNFSMCDSWSGGSFVGNDQGSAIVLLGLKGTTNCYYCGDPNDDSDCRVEESEWKVDCVRSCDEPRGYHCGPYELQVLLYDTEEISRAALGQINPWTVSPYEIWRPSEFFKQSGSCASPGGVVFDNGTKRIFVVERDLGHMNDNAAAVHVWRIPS